MKAYSFGRTRIKVYGGLNSIGGNCIVVESPSKRVMFDQGVNFTRLKKFYGFSIRPDSVEELREMGVLPPREAYDGVEELYISHLHLDHLGSLNVPGNLQIYLPSVELAGALSRAWWFDWKQHLFPQTLSFTGFSTVTESKNIMAAKVSHSAYPSYAFRLETDDATILYTGDFRVSPLYPQFANTLEGFRELSVDRVDVLITEGTNFSRKMNYLSVQQFRTSIKDILEKYKRNILFISVHPLDLESTLIVLELLWKHGFIPVFTNPYYATLLDLQINSVNYEAEGSLIFSPLRTSRIRLLENFETAFISSLKNARIAIFIPGYDIKSIKTIVNLLETDSSGLVHITVFGEPISEEWVVEEIKVSNWLKLLGVTNLRVHLSGHYYPFEFKNLIGTIKPKEMIPIHTNSPDTMKTLFNRYK
ncbi:MAG: hypothetical protein F7B59_04895 [Desulfurococcales archaeon]|nr:hypothetical protein [Desulfurococcales archaeon]